MSLEKGIITSWNDHKGYGFISPDSGAKQLFVHINDCSKKHKRPIKGLAVTYTFSKDRKGRTCASNVCPVKGHKRSMFGPRQIIIGLVFVVVVIAFALTR